MDGTRDRPLKGHRKPFTRDDAQKAAREIEDHSTAGPRSRCAARTGPTGKPEKTPGWFLGHGLKTASDGGASVLTSLFITNALGGNVGDVGLMNASSSLASVPSAIGWGEASDILHRRKMFILIGYLGTGIIFILMGLCAALNQYLGLNILLGVLASASVPMGTLIITETLDEKRWPRTISLYTRFGGLGWIAGLLIGGVWLEIAVRYFTLQESMRMLFFLLGGLALSGAFAAHVLIPEPPIRPFAPLHIDRLVVFQQGRIVERNRYLPLWIYRRLYHSSIHRIHTSGKAVPSSLRYYFIAVLLLFAGFQTVFTPFPIFLIEDARCTGLEIFLIYMVNALSSAALYSRVGDLVERHGEKKLLVLSNLARVLTFAGFGVMAIVFVNGAKVPHILVTVIITALMAVSGFFWAFVSVASTTMVTRLAPAATKGVNTGLFNATISIGGIAGALMGGYFALLFGYTVSFFTGTAMVAAGIFAIAFNRGLDPRNRTVRDREWKEPA